MPQKHLARPNRWQLIDVAHDQEGAPLSGTTLTSAFISTTSTMEDHQTQSSGLLSPRLKPSPWR
jgi:hypothetical protein